MLTNVRKIHYSLDTAAQTAIYAARDHNTTVYLAYCKPTGHYCLFDKQPMSAAFKLIATINPA